MTRKPGLVVVGTDTGVGKTVVAAGIVRALRRRGVAAVPWKPFASGVPADRVEPGEDADLLLRAAGYGPERLAEVSPARFAEALAPLVAAEREGRTVDPAAVLAARPGGGDLLVVEGCGGLMVPLAPGGYDMRELCWDLDLPVLVVARPGLGSVNHTALTVECLRDAGLTVLGVVISAHPGADAGPAERTNPEVIAAYTGVPVLGLVPPVDDPSDVDRLADAVEAALDPQALLAAAREHVDPARADALAADDQALVWHPFTQMKEYQTDEPVVVERARGPWLEDTRGRRYLDAVGSLWTSVHGHREPTIDRAVRAQLGRVAHSTLLGLGQTASIECARRLVAMAPGDGRLSRVFYSDSGSTAVEVALKMAFQGAAQRGEGRRRLFVHFAGSYHGDTIGSVSVGGIDLFHRTFGPLLFEALRAPAPTCYRCPIGRKFPSCEIACLAPYEEVLAERGDEVAAVVVEPVMQGAAGMIPQPAGWLPRVAAGARAAGARLVCDEVATGFGRTGRMFAVEHEGVEPDLLCLAKGLSGGYLPLAATLATEKVHDDFLGEPEDLRTFFHGHTYTGNALACAAASASIDLMLDRDVAAGAARKGQLLGRLLEERLAGHPNVGDVRRRGMMVGVELVADRETRDPLPASERAGWRVCRESTRRGVRLRPLGDVVVLMPPLTLSEELIVQVVETLSASIDALYPRGRTA